MRVVLVLALYDAHSPSDVVLLWLGSCFIVIYLLACFDNFARLETLTIEDFGGFSYYWEMLGKHWVPSNIRKSDASVSVQLKHSLEEVFDFGGAVSLNFLFSVFDGGLITEISC